MGGKKAKEKKGKKKARKTKSSQKWKIYETSDGRAKRKNKICLKCGSGVFMANHKNRYPCGKCGYMEYIREAKKQ